MSEMDEDNAPALLKRRLSVLDCPFASEVNLRDETSLQKLVNWLEDVHIRRYKPSKRAPLRLAPFAPALAAYCRALNLPGVASSSAAAAVPYLVDIALALHYEDCATAYNEPMDPWEGRTLPTVAGSHKEPAVSSLARSIAKRVGVSEVPPQFDAGDTLALAADILESCSEPMSEQSLESLPLGFSTGDEQVDRVATVLRLLHVRELQTLQTAINDAIAGMQAVTADPKTDAKLGKVGRG